MKLIQLNDLFIPPSQLVIVHVVSETKIRITLANGDLVNWEFPSKPEMLAAIQRITTDYEAATA